MGIVYIPTSTGIKCLRRDRLPQATQSNLTLRADLPGAPPAVSRSADSEQTLIARFKKEPTGAKQSKT